MHDAYETQRVYAYTNGKPTVALDVQKAANTSEVTASNAVLAALPALRAQYPDVNFTVLNVQSTYTKEQLSGVTRTLIEASSSRRSSCSSSCARGATPSS